ncbi:DNA polymerase Y family protein [Halococcus saccharolyticus]|uniref:DNA polymerase IV n=1 Tax=Halococcus saccharolyticus DSM 5350 TaxID=1227455 RepID=M0MG68_9EURY|nr:DNA polymerase IV [Halococcus saccharolyticus]EMA44701.1 DNA polymerase IV [Halococcus saccharolyticus DSM 5350]
MAERGDPRLPGVTDDDPDRVICHVDMDCFYAACERLRKPELRGEPVVVGMGYEPGESHGAVATASYEARAHGIESAQGIAAALDRLPRVEDIDDPDDTDAVGHYCAVDMEYYETVSDEVRSVLDDCAGTVRAVSIDEAYLDITDRTSWQRVDGRTLAEGYARHVKERIHESVGVVASVGVAPTMSAAKVASDHDKPDGLVVIEPGEVREFFAPLDVEAVHGVGPVTARELREIGIETAGDLAAADPDALAPFGERGREIRSFARGDDHRSVTPVGRPKSLSRESAFTEATADVEAKRERVATLTAAVADRADREDALYQTIGIKVVTPPFDVNTRARSLPGPVADADLVHDVALSLLAEFHEADVRKLGVRVSNLAFAAGEQSDLDGWETVEPVDKQADGRSDGGTDPTDENRSVGATELTEWTNEEPTIDEGDSDSRSDQGQRTLGEFDADG